MSRCTGQPDPVITAREFRYEVSGPLQVKTVEFGAEVTFVNVMNVPPTPSQLAVASIVQMFETVTPTGSETAEPPFFAVRIAVSTCGPFAAPDVSHEKTYGGDLSAGPRSSPSSWNWMLFTASPPPSASAESCTCPPTTDPSSTPRTS